jgi:hypothetical protein
MLNELRRWVDPRVKRVRVADVQAYLQRRGWTPRPAPRPQQLAFEQAVGNPDERAAIYLPSSEQFADYPQRVLEVITELAEIEDRYAVDVLDDILAGQARAEPNGAARGEAHESQSRPDSTTTR